jgi:hypothetical protein
MNNDLLEYCNICDKMYPAITHQSHIRTNKHKKELGKKRLCDDVTCACQEEVKYDYYRLHEISDDNK